MHLSPISKIFGGGLLLFSVVAFHLLEAFHGLEYFKAELPSVYVWAVGPTVQTGILIVGVMLLVVGIVEIRRLRSGRQEHQEHPADRLEVTVEQHIGGDVHNSPIIGGPNYGPITTNVIHQPHPLPQKKIDNTNPHCDMDWLTLTLHDLFMRDFTYTLRAGATWQVGEPVDIPGSKIEFAVPIDLLIRSRFLVFYITLASNTYNLCYWILEHHMEALRYPESIGVASTNTAPGASSGYSSDEAVFTGAVFVYYEGDFSAAQIKELTAVYASKSLRVSFREGRNT